MQVGVQTIMASCRSSHCLGLMPNGEMVVSGAKAVLVTAQYFGNARVGGVASTFRSFHELSQA